jgi:hypothetical protein
VADRRKCHDNQPVRNGDKQFSREGRKMELLVEYVRTSEQPANRDDASTDELCTGTSLL